MSLEKLLLPPTAQQIEAIKIGIGENTGRYENNMQLLEKWMDCQPYFPKVYDKNMLSVFLRGCKHDMEATKRKLELFLVCRGRMGDIFNTIHFNEEQQKTINNLTKVLFPKLTDEGYRVTFFQLKSNDTSLYDLKTAMILTCMYATLRSCKEHMIAGEYYIFDAKNFTVAHGPKLLVPILKRVIYVFQEAFPYRIRKIAVINAGSFMNNIVSMVKLMLKEKLRNRILIDAGSDILKEDIPNDCLPSDFGGSEKSIADLEKDWRDCMRDQEAWFEKQENLKATGTIPKHLEQSCCFEEGLGVQGSFRQLTID